jgi:hypothetical protein
MSLFQDITMIFLAAYHIVMWANFCYSAGQYYSSIHRLWARGSKVVKAMCYEPEGRGFETQ